MAISPDNKWLAIGYRESQSTRVLSVSSGKQLAAIPCPYGVQCLAFSADGKRLAAGAFGFAGNDPSIAIWELTEFIPD
jgi:WD40 repeat protein